MHLCVVVPVYEHRRCTLAKAPLIVLDDWGFTALSAQDRVALLAILDDGMITASTLVASRFPVDTWHLYVGNPPSRTRSLIASFTTISASS